MKRLMLGNEAVARGLYEAGVRVVSRVRPVRKSPNMLPNMMKCMWSGRQTKRLRQRLQPVHLLAAHGLSAA